MYICIYTRYYGDMKVRVAFTVEVDPVEWTSEFGVEPSDVREDVRNYIAHELVWASSAHADGLIRHPHA